jgi:hypothetical protein
MFKVICPVEKRGGGTYWMRMGSAFTNKDDSINIYLDAVPKNFQLQLRELDEDELRRRDNNQGGASLGGGTPMLPAVTTTNDPVPF